MRSGQQVEPAIGHFHVRVRRYHVDMVGFDLDPVGGLDDGQRGPGR